MYWVYGRPMHPCVSAAHHPASDTAVDYNAVRLWTTKHITHLLDNSKQYVKIWTPLQTYIPLTLYPRRSRHLRYSSETPTIYQNYLAMSNTAVTGGMPMAVSSQSISGANAIYP
jgi:hypothetical protein